MRMPTHFLPAFLPAPSVRAKAAHSLPTPQSLWRLWLLCAIALFLILAGTGHAAQAAALRVDGVRLGVHPDKTRLVFELNAATNFRAFTLADPYRLIIDLPELDWRAGGLPRTPRSSITGLRQGLLETGISRIVVDLAGPVSLRSAFILPGTGGKASRLVVDFLPTSASAFLAEKGKILGTLSPRTPAGQPPSPAMTAQTGTGTRTATTTTNALSLPLSSPTPAPRPQPAEKTPDRPWTKPLIVIDPGHGGVDPGAIGANRVFEKHVTLALGKALRDQLLATGRYRVKMTRDTDIYLHLGERVAFARKNKADLFVSLHADSVGKSNVRGASIYTLSEKASDAQSAKLAERENQSDLIAGVDLRAEDKEVASILVDLAMRETMNQSRFFANTVVTRMDSHGLYTLENPHRFAGFAVLKAPDIPSVLIEAGFMSNSGEARMLSQDAYRRQIADAIVSGIDSYFETVRHYDTP